MFRSKYLFLLSIILMMIVMLIPAFSLSAPSPAQDWMQVEVGGFGDTDNVSISTMAVYRGNLYAGTGRSYYTGCQVWSYDGSNWSQMVGQGPASTPTGPGFGDDINTYATSMAVYGGGLYVGTKNKSDGCEIWRYDGTGWTQSNLSGFGQSSNRSNNSMAVYDGRLYAGTWNINGAQVWSYDGSNWSQMVGQGPAATPTGPGFGDPSNTEAGSMAVYGGRLHVGAGNSAGIQIWSYDGTSWTQESTGGFGDPSNAYHSRMAIYGGRLYVGTRNIDSGTQIWKYDGTSWTQESTGGFGDSDNGESESMTVYNNSLQVGTYNATTGGQVWSTKAAETFYFAEGTTRPGFEPYICIQNAESSAADIKVTYYKGDGTASEQTLSVPANTRQTINVKSELGEGADAAHDFSAKVESTNGVPILAERPMYFNYNGVWAGGHDVMGY